MFKILKNIIGFGFLMLLLVFSINWYVVQSGQPRIFTAKQELDNAYTCIVLGARVYTDGNLSGYLQDRVDAALDLYRNGKVKRFLLSGDHGSKDYDEVNSMKKYLNDRGVPNEDIFLDHAGFNTYNSMVRAAKVFEVTDCIIVSQDYHLPRAVFIANKIGLNAQGFATSSDRFPSANFNKKREVLARNKSFFEVLFSINPTHLGDEIPITGKSDLSYD